MSFAPVGDSWGRRASRRQPTICGIDLNNRRNTSLILLFGTIISALLYTSRYHLAYPDDHPYGLPATIGKQAFATAFKSSVGISAGSGGTDELASEMDGDFEDYHGWGEMENDDDWLLPFQKNSWDPLKSNPTPITEITIKSCVLPPGLYDLCAPVSSKKEDATRGKWVRVDRDLNRRIGIYYLYLFERRLLPNSQAPVITNITILDHSPEGEELSAGGMWTQVSETIRLGVWPRLPQMFLHYKVSEQSEIRAARKASGSNDAGDLEPITELDVIYGGDEVHALPGYEVIPTYITGGADDPKRVKADSPDKGRVGSRLAVRRTVATLPSVPPLQFSADGNFNILQVADLHFSVGPGACRDIDPEREEKCKRLGGDQYSLEWLETALDEVQPDLVVFSGDQQNGQDTSWSSQSAILKWAPLIWKRKIPYTVIFGNHDSELDLTREDQMTLLKSLPFFIGEAGPTGVDGVGNYYRAVKSADSTNTTLLSLYFLDTHALAKSLNPWEKGYDWLKASQINWFKGQSARVSTIERPYAPPYGTLPSGSKGKKPKPKKPSSKKPASDDELIKKPSSKTSSKNPSKTKQKKPKPSPTPAIVDSVDEGYKKMSVRVKRQWGKATPQDSMDEEEEGAGGFSPAVEPDDGSNIGEMGDGEDGNDVEFGDGDVGDEEISDADLGLSPAGGGGFQEEVNEENAENGEVYGDGETLVDTAGDVAEDAEFESLEDNGDEGSVGDSIDDEGKASSGEGAGVDENGNPISEEVVQTDGPMKGEISDPNANDALSPFEEDFETAAPTILADGPTKANPMRAKPNAITFFHIPLPESYDAPVDVGLDGTRLVVGERFEGNGAPKTNSGFFNEALIQQGELLKDGSDKPADEFWEGEFSSPTTGRPETKVVANGHCHISEDCRRVQGVWLCFGGGGSYSGYGRAGFPRRMRVYSVSEYGERIETYKLLDTLEKIDVTVLAGEDAMGSSTA